MAPRMRGKRSAPKAKKSVRGRKSVGRRRQSVRRAKQGMPKRQTLQSSLGGLTMSRFSSAQRPNAVATTIKRAGAPNTINITYPGVLRGEGGRQQYGSWYVNAGNDLRRIWASIQSEYLQVNPVTNAEVTSTTPYTGTFNPTPGNQSFRYVLESSISQLYLANTSGTPLNVELYDIVCKRDLGQVGFDISGYPIQNNGRPYPIPSGTQNGTPFLTPDIAWYQGMANQNTTATGFESFALTEKTDPSNLGATPYQSKLFKDYFKVVRKTNLSLPIGGQHKHFLDLKPNRVIDGDMLWQNSLFKGLSFFTLIVASGVPVVRCPETDPMPPFSNLANPLGDSTTSAVSLSIIQQVKYKWSWVEDTRENIYRANYINNLNARTAQSVQPHFLKVTNADIPATQVGSNGVLSLLPSACNTEVNGIVTTDCGCA